MWSGGNPVVSDLCSAVVSAGVIFAFLQLWKETAKHGLDQKLNRKLVHISIGLFYAVLANVQFWKSGSALAAFTPGVNIIRMLLIGSGMWKDEATVKSMSRFGDHRELLKGPLYYVLTITGACAVYWRTSPIAIAAICNLCAGDGMADIVGRRFGRQKIPYNKTSLFPGCLSCLVFVESLPISTELDDNLTVTLTSICWGTLFSDVKNCYLLVS
ncbi:phytol kinase [Salix suchowensis]|nr:phytol kinase [Salix suchowensis]